MALVPISILLQKVFPCRVDRDVMAYVNMVLMEQEELNLSIGLKLICFLFVYHSETISLGYP